MLDKEDLQAIALLVKDVVKEEITASEQRTDKKLESMEQRIMSGAAVLLETTFSTRFNLLSEELHTIKERLPDSDELEKMQDELDLHHAMLKKHTQEIQQLKKAN